MSNKILNIVLKVAERCNIDCSYCYFFYSNDQSYLKHPPYISQEVIKSLTFWIYRGIQEIGISQVNIGIHGGEPLMLKPQAFSNMCEQFIKVIAPAAKVRFNVQTNGTLINDAWCSIFDNYNIHVGVSLDGPKEYNDKFRLDKKGHGTYDRVIEGINKLKLCKRTRLAGGVSLLSVINPSFDSKKIYRHFFDDIGATFCDFILPITTYDDPMHYAPIEYGRFLCDLFDEWESNNNPNRKIRIISNAIKSFLGGFSNTYGNGINNTIDTLPIISISSNGVLGPGDDLRSCKNLFEDKYTISNITMDAFFALDVFTKIEHARSYPPAACYNCCWQKICNGGTLVTRYSEHNHFDNRSLLCEGLYDFYSHVAAYLIKNGISREKILTNLDLC